jgi:adenylosuccinate lyase
MIPRYSRPEMVAIWSPETRFRIWFEIEAHACFALAEIGVIPMDAAQNIWQKGSAATFDVAKIDEIEAVTKHDVIAFLTHLAEFIGPDSRFVHQGMTSSDVLEPASGAIVVPRLRSRLRCLRRRAEHKYTRRSAARTASRRADDLRVKCLPTLNSPARSGCRRVRPLDCHFWRCRHFRQY